MSRERLKIKVSGVVYDSKDIARKTGVGLNQARYRMNQYQKGHKTKAQLFAPAQKKNLSIQSLRNNNLLSFAKLRNQPI